MKYNFDFSIEEQYKTKKVITDYGQQHIDIQKMNENFYDNNFSQNLDNIEQKWSRSKFKGDDEELKNIINSIEQTFPRYRIDTNEEKILAILKNNGYKIDLVLKTNTNRI